jgi:hypothetical protein
MATVIRIVCRILQPTTKKADGLKGPEGRCLAWSETSLFVARYVSQVTEVFANNDGTAIRSSLSVNSALLDLHLAALNHVAMDPHKHKRHNSNTQRHARFIVSVIATVRITGAARAAT